MPEYVITTDTADGTEMLATWGNAEPHVLIFDRKHADKVAALLTATYGRQFTVRENT